jgi:hypothetical protein
MLAGRLAGRAGPCGRSRDLTGNQRVRQLLKPLDARRGERGSFAHAAADRPRRNFPRVSTRTRIYSPGLVLHGSLLLRRASHAGALRLIQTLRGRDEIFERSPMTLSATVDEMFGAAPGACSLHPRSHPRVAPPRKASGTAARGSFEGGALTTGGSGRFSRSRATSGFSRARVPLTAARRSFRVDSFRRFPATWGARQRLPRLNDGKPTRPPTSATPQTASPDSARAPRRPSRPYATRTTVRTAPLPARRVVPARGLTEESTVSNG